MLYGKSKPKRRSYDSLFVLNHSGVPSAGERLLVRKTNAECLRVQHIMTQCRLHTIMRSKEKKTNAKYNSRSNEKILQLGLSTYSSALAIEAAL